ncbi:MAG: sugar kinase, partial [Myxococcales bacterium]|nr:sugar kinase [Myxococcales bacterium]
MSILVIGTVAFDSVKTPFGEADNVLGGSATYFATSASFFTKVQLVAPIGKDFPDEHVEFLKTRGIDTAGLIRSEGKTFRWKGEYGYELNEAHTLETHLNVLETFKPVVPEAWKETDVLFLANIDPDLQRDVIQQVKRPKLIALDTMNFWISSKVDSLKKTLKLVDIMIINDGEARQLAGESNLVKAARAIMSYGPKTLIIKRGEYGA